jgi:hypothetical protein
MVAPAAGVKHSGFLGETVPLTKKYLGETAPLTKKHGGFLGETVPLPGRNGPPSWAQRYFTVKIPVFGLKYYRRYRKTQIVFFDTKIRNKMHLWLPPWLLWLSYTSSRGAKRGVGGGVKTLGR